MRACKLSLALGNTAFLLVVLCGVGFLRKQHKMALIADAREKIEKNYNSQRYNLNPRAESEPTSGFHNLRFSDTRQIQRFSLQGDTATVWLRWHFVTTWTEAKKLHKRDEGIRSRDQWKRRGSKWFIARSETLSFDAVEDGKLLPDSELVLCQ